MSRPISIPPFLELPAVTEAAVETEFKTPADLDLDPSAGIQFVDKYETTQALNQEDDRLAMAGAAVGGVVLIATGLMVGSALTTQQNNQGRKRISIPPLPGFNIDPDASQPQLHVTTPTIIDLLVPGFSGNPVMDVIKNAVHITTPVDHEDAGVLCHLQKDRTQEAPSYIEVGAGKVVDFSLRPGEYEIGRHYGDDVESVETRAVLAQLSFDRETGPKHSLELIKVDEHVGLKIELKNALRHLTGEEVQQSRAGKDEAPLAPINLVAVRVNPKVLSDVIGQEGVEHVMEWRYHQGEDTKPLLEAVRNSDAGRHIIEAGFPDISITLRDNTSVAGVITFSREPTLKP